MSLLSDLNNKIKALSTRMGAEVKSLWSGVNSAQSTATAAQTTANTANSTANSALSTANTKVSKTGDTMTGNLSFSTDKTLGVSWGINGGTATLRAYGAAGSQAIALLWKNSEGSTIVNTILDSSGNFLPSKTYTAGTGLSLSSKTFSLAASGATAGSYGPSADASPAHKGTFSVPYITVDATGRVTDISTKTITLPADNNTTYSNMTAATASAAGKAGLVPAPAAGKQTSFLRGDGTWVVPTNTTYTAGTGLSLSGTKFSLATSGVTAGTAGGTTSATLNHGSTFTTPYITFDEYGRVTGYGTRTLTLPSDNNTDTKVTNTASNTTKFYITGTSSSSTNTGTQYFDTGVYVTATAGYLHCTRLEVGSGTIWVA